MNYKFETSYEAMTSSNSGGGKLCYSLTSKTPQIFMHYKIANALDTVSETLTLLGVAQPVWRKYISVL